MSTSATRRWLGCTLVAATAALGLVSAPAQAAGNRLSSGQQLLLGQELVSSNGQHHLNLGNANDEIHLQISGDSCLPSTLSYGANTSADLRLVMQTDGNLVLYSDDGAMWNTQTQGHPGAFVTMQDDMNLVVYSADGQPLWATGSFCSLDYQSEDDTNDQRTTEFRVGHFMQSPNGRYRLIVQADGNLVLYSPTKAVWWTGTSGNQTHLNHQADNNVVLYDDQGKALWSSGTASTNPATTYRTYLFLEDDGHLALYREATSGPPRLIWRS
ncbi:MAG: hypothetical protein ACK5MT_13035 [Actinomycetales bacterium]